MTIADRFAAWIGAIGVIVVGALNYYASTGSDKVKVDIEMIGFAKVVLLDPDSSLALRYWAVDVLGTWKEVPMTPQRKKQIAEELQKAPVKSLDKIPAAQVLNQMLKADPVWNSMYDVEDLYSVRDLHSIGKAPQGETPGSTVPMPTPLPNDGSKIEQQPGTGSGSPEQLEQQ